MESYSIINSAIYLRTVCLLATSRQPLPEIHVEHSVEILSIQRVVFSAHENGSMQETYKYKVSSTVEGEFSSCVAANTMISGQPLNLLDEIRLTKTFYQGVLEVYI